MFRSELDYIGWWEVEGHIVRLGLNRQTGEHLDELILNHIVAPSD